MTVHLVADTAHEWQHVASKHRQQAGHFFSPILPGLKQQQEPNMPWQHMYRDCHTSPPPSTCLRMVYWAQHGHKHDRQKHPGSLHGALHMVV